MNRCFILGNGPSLSTHDLDLLKGQVTFACNKIHRLYHTTTWRPTHWCSLDRTDYTTTIAEYLSHFREGYECHVAADWFGFRTGRVDPTEWKNVHVHTVCNAPHETAQPWSHISKVSHELCRYNGTGNSAIELAIRHMGYDEVYVLGFDLGYTDDETRNHFDPAYLPSGTRSMDQARRMNQRFLEAHQIAKAEADARGAVIYNAGRLDNLPYEQVVYEDVV